MYTQWNIRTSAHELMAGRPHAPQLNYVMNWYMDRTVEQEQ